MKSYTYGSITASVPAWESVGFEEITWIGGKQEVRRKDMYSVGASDAELLEAQMTTGSNGDEALIWLAKERRRQQEEAARNRAMQEQAAAQRKHGDDLIHAARIHRQAEELHCLANGVDGRAVSGKLR